MEAIANTYETLARTRSDEELQRLAVSRNAAASGYEQQAVELAQRMGRQPSAVDTMIDAAHERIRVEAEATRGNDAAFTAFLQGRGAAADACVRDLGEVAPA